jgi:hypothetical protein
MARKQCNLAATDQETSELFDAAKIILPLRLYDRPKTASSNLTRALTPSNLNPLACQPPQHLPRGYVLGTDTDFTSKEAIAVQASVRPLCRGMQA